MKPLHDSTTLLHMIADRIADQPTEFDMTFWGWHFSARTTALERDTRYGDGCGTAMCIGGWALQEGLSPADRAEVTDLSVTAGSLLGLRDGGVLFYATWLQAPGAVDVLRRLAALPEEGRTYDAVRDLLHENLPAGIDDPEDM